MADADAPMEDENDDSWLYGGGGPGPGAETEDTGAGAAEGEEKEDGYGEENKDEEGEGDEDDDEHNRLQQALTGHLDDEHFEEQPEGDEEQEGRDDVFGEDQNGDGQQENGDSDSDDSEDDVKVILGDNKTQPTQAYTNLNIKRSNLMAQASHEKQKQAGKFTIEDFESVGNINGVPAQEFNIDVLEDKPWRKPGADITDYFNYGFTEETWRAYCEKQKRMRVQESGSGLIPLGGKDLSSGGVNNQSLRQLTPISNEHTPNKYPPPPIMTGPKPGSINVVSRIDGQENMSEPPPPISPMHLPPPSHNTIQVMTADRRNYGRGKFPDITMPPPGPDSFYNQPPDHQPPFYPPYEEPWGPERVGWTPGDIKELTPGPPLHMGPPGGMIPPPGMGPPPMNMGPPPMGHPQMMMRPPMGPQPHMVPGPNMPPYGPPPGHIDHIRERERERERERDHREREREYREHRDRDIIEDKESRDSAEMRDRDRERSRSIKPDRHREKSHRRERSRSRSRRHKSRSRSPSSRHRSKKKAHHKDKDDSD